MQMRGLMIAVSVLAVLAGGVWYTNKNPESTTKTEKLEQLVTLLQADLVEVTVARKGEEPLLLRKNSSSGNWEIVMSPSVPTSSQDAMDVVTNVSTISADQVVEENATDLIQYGLEPAQFTLTLKDKTGKTQQLLVGDQAPVGFKFYARRPNEKKVFAIAQTFKVGFDKSVNDLRDKRLMIIDDTKLARLEVVRKQDSFEFGKNSKGAWGLVKPQPYRTDAVVVDEALSKVREAKFDPSLAEDAAKKYAAGFATATTAGTLKLIDGMGTKTLEVRKTKDNEYLAKSSTVEGIHKVSEDLAKIFDKGLEDYRNKKLMDFGFEDPTRIQVDAGGKSSVLERKGEDWIWNGKKADPATVTEFLQGLRGLSAMTFVDKGFAEPTFTVTLTQRDGKTVEKLMVSKVGNFHYVRRQSETGDYEVDPKAFAELEAAVRKIKEAGAAKK